MKRSSNPLRPPLLDSHTVPPELVDVFRGTHISDNVNPVTNIEEALYDACYKGHVKKVKRLIKSGAHVNSVNLNGDTPLYAACSKGHVEIVNKLIKHGALVDLTNNNEKTTPLYQASKQGYTEIVRLLIEHGADINLPDKDGTTSLHCAYFKGHNEILELFIKNEATLYETKERLFYTSCLTGNLQAATLFIKYGINVNLENIFGTPLAWACSCGHTEIAKLLINNGAVVNVMDNGETLLYSACSNGYTGIAKLLIENGANVNLLSNCEKKTPLCQASQQGHTEIVKLLIDSGADINQVDQDGIIPVYYAFFEDYNDIVALFLENKATTRECKEGLLCCACKHGNFEIAKLLIQHGVDVNLEGNGDDGTALDLACSNGHVEIAKLLIQNGANINAMNRYGGTSLSFASSENHTEIIKLLIDSGADINLPDDRGVTVLYSTCSKDQTEVATLLTNKGAKVNIASNSGRTSLYHASKQGNSTIVKNLLSCGAYVDAASNSGRTALCHARLKEHREIVELLIYSAMLQNIADETPNFIQKDEKLSAVWDTLRKIEAIKEIKSKIVFSFYDLTEKDVDILSKSITNRDLKFLREQVFPDYTDGLIKRLEAIHLHKKERSETIDALLSNSCFKYNLFSHASEQNRNQNVQLTEDDIRMILEFLETKDLKTMTQAVNMPYSFNNS
ncbi:ankyrin repeat domain-containing protein [Rickettsiella grylli]|uniref:Uncharacterized protein n=1 Tax=Rickettsiella grylli TaxID=59196 RepID=A8PMI2_9COXI|nr:ankyrin repeat domain-containing protein [Rickettsiella grylli]EDP46450.1 conserved hypothetical protein [Rickettsiella grylli]